MGTFRTAKSEQIISIHTIFYFLLLWAAVGNALRLLETPASFEADEHKDLAFDTHVSMQELNNVDNEFMINHFPYAKFAKLPAEFQKHIHNIKELYTGENGGHRVAKSYNKWKPVNSIPKNDSYEACAMRNNPYNIVEVGFRQLQPYRFEIDQTLDWNSFLRGRHIALVGDSTTQQFFASFACTMGMPWKGFGTEFNRQQASTENDKIRSFNGGRLGKACIACGGEFHGRPPILGFDRFPLPGGGSIVYYRNVFLNLEEQRKVLDYIAHANPNAVIVYQFHPAGPLESNFLMQKGIIEHCRDKNMPCVFVEHAPQHFVCAGSKSGLYEDCPPGKGTCRTSSPLWKSYEAPAAMRNDMLRYMVSEFGKKGTDILPIFEDLVVRADAHKKDIDCTHFAFNSEIYEPWHASFYRTLMRY